MSSILTEPVCLPSVASPLVGLPQPGSVVQCHCCPVASEVVRGVNAHYSHPPLPTINRITIPLNIYYYIEHYTNRLYCLYKTYVKQLLCVDHYPVLHVVVITLYAWPGVITGYWPVTVTYRYSTVPYPVSAFTH